MKKIGLIWGDGSSPEIMAQAKRVLDKVQDPADPFVYTDIAMGGEAVDKYGDPLPQHELDKALAQDSVLLGAIGGPKWEGLAGPQRPEKGLLRLREGMELFANDRPAKIWPQLADASPLKKEITDKGIDFVIVRELIGGPTLGKRKRRKSTGNSWRWMKCPIPSMKSSALDALASKLPGNAGRNWSWWTNTMCWTPAASG